MICPRSAILHSAAASIVDGTTGLTVSIADMIATRTSSNPSAWPRSIAFCTISTLSARVGAMLTAASCNDQRVLMAGDIHHKAMADPPSRADTGIARDDRTHQLVCM